MFHPLTLSDIPAALALQRAAIVAHCAADYGEEATAAWADALQESDFNAIVMGDYFKWEEGGTLRAIGGWQGDNLKLFYVAPELKGQGAATSFWQALEGEYLKTNPSHMHVIATLTATPFYLHHGFVAVEEYQQPITETLTIPMRILTKKY